jgi:hypothetical protein
MLIQLEEKCNFLIGKYIVRIEVVVTQWPPLDVISFHVSHFHVKKTLAFYVKKIHFHILEKLVFLQKMIYCLS